MKAEYDFSKGTRNPGRARRLKSQKRIRTVVVDEKKPEQLAGKIEKAA